jgi:hypothetical protein
MKTIVNRSKGSVKIQLPGNKTLFLGPSKSGQISDEAALRPAFLKLVKSGAVEVVGEGERHGTGGRDEGHVHEGTHGHAPRKVVLPKGDR